MNRGKYALILAESSLELVPRSLWKHPAVIKNARRRGKKPSEILLDTSIHYHAMKTLPKREKIVHTIEDYVISVKPEVRIPKNYNRFVGLMEQLLKYGRVPPEAGEPLMFVKTMKLKDLIDKIKPRKVILFSEKGEKIRLTEIPKFLRKGDAFIIGGFPHGDFEEETYAVCDEVYSLYSKTLETWTVLSRILAILEMDNNVL